MLRPGPRWGANSAPPDLLAGFWGEKKGKREGIRIGNMGKGKGDRE